MGRPHTIPKETIEVTYTILGYEISSQAMISSCCTVEFRNWTSVQWQDVGPKFPMLSKARPFQGHLSLLFCGQCYKLLLYWRRAIPQQLKETFAKVWHLVHAWNSCEYTVALALTQSTTQKNPYIYMITQSRSHTPRELLARLHIAMILTVSALRIIQDSASMSSTVSQNTRPSDRKLESVSELKRGDIHTYAVPRDWGLELSYQPGEEDVGVLCEVESPVRVEIMLISCVRTSDLD